MFSLIYRDKVRACNKIKPKKPKVNNTSVMLIMVVTYEAPICLREVWLLLFLPTILINKYHYYYLVRYCLTHGNQPNSF